MSKSGHRCPQRFRVHTHLRYPSLPWSRTTHTSSSPLAALSPRRTRPFSHLPIALSRALPRSLVYAQPRHHFTNRACGNLALDVTQILLTSFEEYDVPAAVLDVFRRSAIPSRHVSIIAPELLVPPPASMKHSRKWFRTPSSSKKCSPPRPARQRNRAQGYAALRMRG
jgi:hypothetical protein